MKLHASQPAGDLFDLLIKNGTVMLEIGAQQLDIGVKSGKIVALAPRLQQQAQRVIDARHREIFPGIIDAHTHMGIPIRNTFSADDFASGSIAAAFGGVTTILDFSVQEKGQSIRQALEARLAQAQRKSHVDFSIHVNITDQPERWLGQIPELIADGFVSFKVFSTYREAGMMVTWTQFREILRTIHAHDGLLMLHAEDNALIEAATDNHVRARQFAPIYHARSRTPEAEARAIARAAQIAGELDAGLYIVHLSSRAGLEQALAAKQRGVKLYLETCPQYLLLDASRYEAAKGHFLITTPPLRSRDDSDALWQALADGMIDVVGTDHCPFTMQQKNAGQGDFLQTPNGLPGVGTLFPLLYTYGVREGRLPRSRLLQVLAKKPAALFRIADRKGEIRPGADADFVIWNPKPTTTISENTLHGNADWSPYAGMKIAGELAYTILRGEILVENGRFCDQVPQGELLRSKPAPS